MLWSDSLSQSHFGVTVPRLGSVNSCRGAKVHHISKGVLYPPCWAPPLVSDILSFSKHVGDPAQHHTEQHDVAVNQTKGLWKELLYEECSLTGLETCTHMHLLSPSLYLSLLLRLSLSLMHSKLQTSVSFLHRGLDSLIFYCLTLTFESIQ